MNRLVALNPEAFGPEPDVLFVGINYAPEQTGIGPYTTAAAEHLAGLGLRVRVLTGLPHYPQWEVDPADDHGGREVRNGVEIERFRHAVPRRQDALRRGWYELTFAAQLLRRRRLRPAVVVAVVPSLLSAVVAAAIARRAGARLVLWIQDSMGAAATQSGISGGRQVARVVGAVERHLFRRAELTLVVSGAFRPHVLRCGAASESVIDVPNWTHVAESSADRAELRDRLGWAPDDAVVLHSGNMGLKQDLGRIIDAARQAQTDEPSLRFVLLGQGSQRAELERAAATVPNVVVMDPVGADAYSDVLAAADVLVVNERAGVLDMSLPSKLTSYFAAGRPVVASVHAEGGTAYEVRRSGAGVVTADQSPAALLAAIRTVVAHPEWAAELGHRGRAHARRHLAADRSLSNLADLIVAGRQTTGELLATSA